MVASLWVGLRCALLGSGFNGNLIRLLGEVRNHGRNVIRAEVQVRHIDLPVFFEQCPRDWVSFREHLFRLLQVALQPSRIAPFNDAGQIWADAVAVADRVAGCTPAFEDELGLADIDRCGLRVTGCWNHVFPSLEICPCGPQKPGVVDS